MRSFTLGQRSKLTLGWSCSHLDKSGFLPVLKRAHFQALLDKGKWEPVGGRAGQAAGNLVREDPGAQKGPSGPGWRQSPSAPQLPSPRHLHCHGWGLLWLVGRRMRIRSGLCPQEFYSLIGKVRPQPTKETSSRHVLCWGEKQFKGHRWGGLERWGWWQASRSEAPWPGLCPQVSSEVGHHALNDGGDSRLTGWTKGTFLRGRITHMCSHPLYHHSCGIRAARPGLCSEIWPRLLT